MSLVAANREMWELIRDGVAVMVHDPDHGGQRPERVRVVDWQDPTANDFLVVSQMTFTGALYTRRPDVVFRVSVKDAMEENETENEQE